MAGLERRDGADGQAGYAPITPDDSARRRPRRPTLLLWAMSLVLIAYVWTTALSLILSDRRLALQREADNLERLSQSLAAFTGNLLGSLELAVQYLEGWLVEHQEADPRFDTRFSALTDLYRHSLDDQVDIRMVSQSGGLFYIPSSSNTPMADVTDREYYLAQVSAAPGTLHFARSVLSRVTQKWGLPVSYRLAQPNHGIFILFAALELDVLLRRYREALPGQSAVILLLRDDGTILNRYPFDATALGMVAFALEGGRLQAETAVGKLPLTVRISIARDEVEAHWRRSSLQRQVMAGVVTLAILLLAGLSAGQWRRIGAYQDRVERLAVTDSLTGLSTRQEFFASLAAELARARRYGRSFGFLMVDLDGFKTINDHFGHPEGDRVLSAFAGRLRSALRDCDVCGRVGGDEFAAFLPEANQAGLAAIAERVCQAARTVALPEGGPLSVSVGGVVWQPGDETAAQVYARADMAMYRSKQSGHDQVTLD